METVGTRELKQNPQAVIRRVLTSGQEVEVTAYGKPTGVRLVPDHGSRRSRWIRGDDLHGMETMSRENAADLKTEIERERDGDVVEDPWGDPA
ncbi:hypothetical protein V5D56_05665 [Cellulosimicrobium sp. PMB13]|uniref:type II toxin-antitoxin system Phd/YefM family antitoxin n=1 Tax=Cellulosimicrobium sp. PMB13 TaxID=3120158 RepID=UPI003F4C768F